MTVRVLLADDQALLRATFRLLLEATDGLTVVGEAADGREAIELTRRNAPDVVLMDIRMPVLDGVEATRLISADPALAATRVLILTTFETDELVVAALRAGASGFLGKDVAPAALIDALHVVAGGEQLLSPTATRALIQRVTSGPEPRTPGRLPGIDPLTERELEITTLVARGLSNGEIAALLVISPATAKTHVNRAMMKTGARDRAQLVVFAYEAGLA